MKTTIHKAILGSLIIAGLGATGCDEPHASSGSTDATSANAYELNSEENLAPAMDSVAHPAPMGDTLRTTMASDSAQ